MNTATVHSSHRHCPAWPVCFHCVPGTNPALEAKLGGGYSWAPSNHPSFFPGRQATITARGQQVGIFGIVHPEVLGAFDVEHPVSALEMTIEPFCFDTHLKSLMHEMHGWNLVH